MVRRSILHATGCVCSCAQLECLLQTSLSQVPAVQGVPAALKGDTTQWKLHRDKITAAPSRRRNYVQPDAAPWLLEDRKGAITHKGQLEGGIATDNYFVLMKNSDGFTVLPVKSWYTFKPPPRCAC